MGIGGSSENGKGEVEFMGAVTCARARDLDAITNRPSDYILDIAGIISILVLYMQYCRELIGKSRWLALEAENGLLWGCA